jgi:hypothetical protein
VFERIMVMSNYHETTSGMFEEVRRILGCDDVDFLFIDEEEF